MTNDRPTDAGEPAPDGTGWDRLSLDRTMSVLAGFARRLLATWPRLRTRVDERDLVQDVLRAEWDSRGRDGRPLPTLAFLKTCVYHRAVTIDRQTRRFVVMPPGDLDLPEGAHGGKPGAKPGAPLVLVKDPPEDPDPNDAKGTLGAEMAELRDVLHRGASRPPGREVVYFHGVLLLHLRFALTARTSRVVANPEQELADWVEYLLPWTGKEAAGPLRPGWPTILQVWVACRPDIDRPPHRVDAEALGARIAGLMDVLDLLGADAWYKWLQRAKKLQRALTTDDEWTRLLAPLLPQRAKEMDK